jgi:hypothetical protein
MSNNTNSLFWIITGAVIVLAVFLLNSATNNNTIDKIFDNFSGYFSKEISGNDDGGTPEVNLDQYIPSGWTVMDIVMTNGVVYVAGNFKSIGGGSYQFDFRIINTNDYDVHIKNSSIAFINSETHEVITSSNLPFDQVLTPGNSIKSFSALSKNLGAINHYITFVPWS